MNILYLYFYVYLLLSFLQAVDMRHGCIYVYIYIYLQIHIFKNTSGYIHTFGICPLFFMSFGGNERTKHFLELLGPN